MHAFISLNKFIALGGPYTPTSAEVQHLILLRILTSPSFATSHQFKTFSIKTSGGWFFKNFRRTRRLYQDLFPKRRKCFANSNPPGVLPTSAESSDYFSNNLRINVPPEVPNRPTKRFNH
ncbi:MAG: hypothetical protein ACTS44_00860 [Candidatus Hodgkinia cicadicola]